MRKTIEVKYILERGNYFLANSEPEQSGERKGVASMIELALHETGTYKGYGYLASAEINHDGWEAAWDRHRAIAEIRKANGIKDLNHDPPCWEDYCEDDTRRVYYTHPKLKLTAAPIRIGS